LSATGNTNAAGGQAALWLASTSPRREALLRQLGVRFDKCQVAVDEAKMPGETPGDYVRRMALSKLDDGLRRLAAQDRYGAVIAADTVVEVDDQVLGKPTGRESALAMLALLSGRAHQVLSCVALARVGDDDARSAPPHTATSVSRVWFRELSERERERYWATGEPADKAGGYAIQGLAAAFVERLQGSYTGVVGLPLFETARLLSDAGVIDVV
jgi:septum formation protein